MTHAELIRSWPITYQSLFWKLVDSEDVRPAEAVAIVLERMRQDAERRAA